jgi:ABC-type transport system involved in multi-copper enzyme maturation permease subunit
MIWYKTWLETRWGFIFNVLLFAVLAFGAIPRDPAKLARRMARLQSASQQFGAEAERVIETLSSFQGTVWDSWFKLLLTAWPMVAVAMGAILLHTTCQVMGSTQSGSVLYTLSLPVTRRRVLLAPAVMAAAELMALSLVPSVLLSFLCRLWGETFPVGEAVIYGLLVAVGGMVFFSFSFLLSTILKNGWTAIFIGWGVVIALWLPSWRAEAHPWWSLLRVMSGQDYLLNNQIPWIGLIICLALAAAMFSLSIRIFERRDF